MKKLLITLILAVVSSSAMAEWVFVGEDAHRTINIYVDYNTIRKTGNMVKMWSLYDYKTVMSLAGYKYLSQKLQNEYDCQEEKSRIIVNIYYDRNMGGRAISPLSRYTPDVWVSVPPGSVNEHILKIACNN